MDACVMPQILREIRFCKEKNGMYNLREEDFFREIRSSKEKTVCKIIFYVKSDFAKKKKW